MLKTSTDFKENTNRILSLDIDLKFPKDLKI